MKENADADASVSDSSLLYAQLRTWLAGPSRGEAAMPSISVFVGGVLIVPAILLRAATASAQNNPVPLIDPLVPSAAAGRTGV